MRLFLLLIFVLPALCGYSQLVTEGRASAEGLAEETTIGYTFEVTNTGSANEEFYWDLVRPAEMPAEWVFTICDVITCWEEGIEVLDCFNPNSLEAGASHPSFKVSLNPNLVPGEHTVDYRLLKSCGDAVPDDDVILNVAIKFTVGATATDVSDLDIKSEMKLYPNPTSDRFQISDDSRVSNITIFNVVGKQIIDESHSVGQAHDISTLDNGMYLVRLMNDAQEVVTILRMTKE